MLKQKIIVLLLFCTLLCAYQNSKTITPFKIATPTLHEVAMDDMGHFINEVEASRQKAEFRGISLYHTQPDQADGTHQLPSLCSYEKYIRIYIFDYHNFEHARTAYQESDTEDSASCLITAL